MTRQVRDRDSSCVKERLPERTGAVSQTFSNIVRPIGFRPIFGRSAARRPRPVADTVGKRQAPYVTSKAPSENSVGARIRVSGGHIEEASRLFAENGYRPIHVDHRPDGSGSFWFGKMPDRDLDRLVRVIPPEFYALHATVRDGS